MVAVTAVAAVAAEAAADAVREAAAPPRSVAGAEAVAVEVPGMRGVAVARARLATARWPQPREPPPPPSRAPAGVRRLQAGVRVFPASGDRDVSVRWCPFERKGLTCALLSGDEATSMSSELIRETKARSLEHGCRIAVFEPRPAAAHRARPTLALRCSGTLGRGARAPADPKVHRPGNGVCAGIRRARPAAVRPRGSLRARSSLPQRLARGRKLLGAEEDDRVRVYPSCVLEFPGNTSGIHARHGGREHGPAGRE